VVDGQGEVAAFCDSTDQWLPLVCTMNVTVVTEQVRDMYPLGSEASSKLPWPPHLWVPMA
jgi:hypothetical protein